MSIPIDPIAEFPKVENMLYKLAWRTADAYPITFEEARSEAYWAFMRACQDYNPKKGAKFSSWCYFWVWTHLKTVVTKRSVDPLMFMDVQEDMAGEVPPTEIPSLEFAKEMSLDAQEMIAMLLEVPKELVGVATTPTRHLDKVKDHMVAKKGRDRQQVNAAVKEIAVTFRNYWGQRLSPELEAFQLANF